MGNAIRSSIDEVKFSLIELQIQEFWGLQRYIKSCIQQSLANGELQIYDVLHL
jgi:hypothetical protein